MREHYIYGLHAVLSAVEKNPQRIKKIIIDKGRLDKNFQSVLSLSHKLKIEVQYADKKYIKGLVPEVSQGILAIGEYFVGNESTLKDLLAKKESFFFLVLDNIQDPHNLGACIRSANAAGVDAVIATEKNSASLSPVVYKVASGALEDLLFIQVTNLVRVIKLLKEYNIWVYGAMPHKEGITESIYKTDFKGSVALVLGSEGSGLRRLTKENCDILVDIPMFGSVSSLNVSVASGICLFEAMRQRKNL